MRLRRMLAFVLTLAMLMGNVTPAFAADSSVVNTVSGNVQITTDENGNTVITDISDETSDVETVSDEEGSTEESESQESEDVTPGEKDSQEETTESQEEESSEETTEETGGEEVNEAGGETDEDSDESVESEESDVEEEKTENESEEADETVSDNDAETEDATKDETDETVSDNDMTVSTNSIVKLNDATVVEVRNHENEWEGDFSSLQEAKNYIAGKVENNEAAERYIIAFCNDATIAAGESGALDYPDAWAPDIRLELNGYTLTINDNQRICVDEFEAGRYQEDESVVQGSIVLAEGKTLEFIPRSGENNANIWIGNANIAAAEGDVVFGKQPYSGNFTNVHNVTATVRNMAILGGLYWDGEGAIDVGSNLNIFNDKYCQDANFQSYLKTKNMHMEANSAMRVKNFEASADTGVVAGSGFTISAGGNAVFHNLDVSSNGDEWSSFFLAVEQKVKLNGVDAEGKAYADYTDEEWNNKIFVEGNRIPVEEIFANKEILSGKSTFTITGEVSREADINFPIRVEKNYCWDLKDKEWQKSCGVEFDNGEIFAVVNAGVPANVFTINSENGCVRKWTDDEGVVRLQAAATAVSVMAAQEHVDENGDGYTDFIRGIVNDYASLENAVEGIPNDFDGHWGEYHFYFKDDMSLESDITIPECVEQAYFETEGAGVGEGETYQHIGNYQKYLDLNGHTLETSAKVVLHTGLRIMSNDAAGAGKLNILTGPEYVALEINENSTLVGADKNIIEHRSNVLSNVAVNAEDRKVSFEVKDYRNDNEYPMQDMQDVSLNVKELAVYSGNWRFDQVTASNLYVSGSFRGWDDEVQEDVDFAKASLYADDITIQNYKYEDGNVEPGFMEVRGTVGSFDEGGVRPNLTLIDSKLFIADDEENGDCYLDILTVDTVYSNEEHGDCTVESNGQFFVDTMNMNGAKLVNRRNMIVNKISALGNFQNDHEASLICNTVEQQSGKQTEFMDNSRMLINVSGTLNNIRTGHAVLGKGSNAQININGSFEVTEEDLRMEMAVTDSYAEISTLKNEMTNFNPYAHHDDGNTSVMIEMPEPGHKLFTTDMEEFPTENIAVLPWEMLDENGKIIRDENGNPNGNPNTSAYQYKVTGENGQITTNEIQVSGETVSVFAVSPNGSDASWLKGFTSWREAMNYLMAVGNPNTQYLVNLNTEEMDFGGNMNLPSNVAGMIIFGADNKPAVLKNTGKINLVTDIIFENVTFEEATEIEANGHDLEFYGIRSVTLNEDDTEKIDASVIAKITGVANSNVLVQGSYMKVKEMSAIRELVITGATLMTEDDISADTLVLRNQPSEEGEQPAYLNACGKVEDNEYCPGSKVEVNDIILYGRGNTLLYGDLKINGTLKSYAEDEESLDYSNVFAVWDEENGYYRIQDDRPQVDESEEIPEYVEVKRNALNLLPYTDGSQIGDEDALAIAPNIASTWFVFDYAWRDDQDTILNVTHKAGNEVRLGRKADQEADVILSMCVRFEKVENEITGESYDEPIYAEIDRYESLQEAFDAIEVIGDSEQLYEIILNSDVESTEDLMFPSKVQCIWIEGAGEGKTISFPAELKVNSHIDFKNVKLQPKAENGSLNIDQYRVTLIESSMKDNVTVVGNGNNCELHVADSVVNLQAVENVDILSAYLDAKVTVKEDIAVKTLWLNKDVTICGLSAIEVTDVECYGSNTIITIPTIKKLEEEYGQNVITAMNSNLAISGNLNVYELPGQEEVKGCLNIELGKIENDGISFWTIDDFAYQMMYSGNAVIAKAPKADISKVVFNKGKGGEYDLTNYLYKNNGNIVCKYHEPGVELSYENEVNGKMISMVTPCLSFADAVEEINSLNTKRNYTIRFLDNVRYAKELKLPNNTCVDTLTITSAKNVGENEGTVIFDIWYTGDITLTCNVVMEDISLIQAESYSTVSGNSYRPVNKPSKAVKINTGGNNLTFGGSEVTFNTPLALDGGSKGTLSIDEGTRIIAADSDTNPIFEGDSYVQGTISKFAEVSVSQKFILDGWTDTKNKYVPASINVTALKVNSDFDNEIWADVTVGHAIGMKDTVKVNDLILNGGNLYVYGDGEFKNVTFAQGAAELWIYGQKFNITGVLTSTVAYAPVIVEDKEVLGGAKLVTNVNSKLEPVLNVSGTVALGDAQKNRVIVRVMDTENDVLTDNKAVPLGRKAGDTTYYKYLLKAKKADETAFLADWDCIGEKDVFNFDTLEGDYFLKKNKDFVEVAYVAEDGVVLRKNKNAADSYVNYYEDLDAALSAIKSFKDKDAAYEVTLLGSTKSDYALTLPDKASYVIFNGKEKENASVTLYNTSKKNVQKTDIIFENIKVENTGTWDSKKLSLEIVNADVTIKDKTTVSNLIITDGSVLRTEAATVITDIKNGCYFEDCEQSRIVYNPGTLTIKGYIEDFNFTGLELEIPKLILEAKDAKTISTAEDNKAQYILSDASKLAVLEKETMDKFEFRNGNADVTENVVWASKGIYYLPDGYTNAVIVEKMVQLEDNGENNAWQPETEVRCLDIAEASNYINTISDKNSIYNISLKDGLDAEVTDTKVTDTQEHSALTLPNKDTAYGVSIVSDFDIENAECAEVTFTGDLKANGMVEFVNIDLKNDNFNIICEKNSDVKNGKQVIPGTSYIALVNSSAEGLNSIAGAKGATNVDISGTDLNMSGGITGVAELCIDGGSKLITNEASDVKKVALYGSSNWNAMGATVIQDVELYDLEGTGTEGKEPAVYIGTYLNSDGIPQLTVNGKVTGSILPIKVAGKVEKEEYKGIKLVSAKTESADKFIAFPYAQYFEEEIGEDENGETVTGYKANFPEGIMAYKEDGVYVCNGEIAAKQVILGKLESAEDGEVWSDTYVANYKEAIDMINSQGNKEAVYKITFIKGNDTADENHIVLDNMLLPKTDTAQRLVIDGAGKTLTYSGSIKATCDLEYVNITLDEVKDKETVRGIAVDADKYNVTFGENVATVFDARTNENIYNLEFSSIKGSKGSVGFGGNRAYSYGEVNVGGITVTQSTELYAENKVTIGDIKYMNGGSFALAGEKAITINNVYVASEDIWDAFLDVTTWFTNAKTLDKSKSQLTVKGEVSPKIGVNINPLVPHVGYDEYDHEYVEHRMLDDELFWDFMLWSDEKPQTFQKIITAPKMMASENVTLIGRDCRAVRYDGGIYFGYGELIEVIGYEEVKPEENNGIPYKEVFNAGYFGWDMAVKEIDKLNRTDWAYDIIVTHDLGVMETPLKTLSLPSKAKAVAVIGVGDTGILMASNKVAIKCPTEFRNISLCAVKSATDYTPVPLTLDGGKFYMSLSDIQSGCNLDNYGWFNSELKLTGKNTIEMFLSENDYCDAISQINNTGTVIFNSVIRYDEESEEIREHAHYNVEDGIQKVNLLQIMPGAEVISNDSDISVKDLYLGEASGEQEQQKDEKGNVVNVSQKRNRLDSNVCAKNIESTGTTTMASATLKAGTMEVGDGKITLNNVVFKDTHNHIEGKQGADGNSLISIKGSTSTEDVNPGWSAATISLCLSNSSRRYAQLNEDMHIMTAPKAFLSLFRPHYNWDGESNMGPEITEFLPWFDENGEPIKDKEGNVQGREVPLYGFYKSGNDIKYGRLREIDGQNVIERNEVILWLGTSNPNEVDGNVPNMEYATFEEAIAAINSMPNYKEYTIEVMKDVEIGNENGDGKYKALTLPAKIDKLAILGYGQQYIYFSGNLALKSNTSLEGINLVPMKTVKGICAPATTNITVGNYELSVMDARVGYWDGEPYNSTAVSCLDKVSGSAKGRLILREYTGMVADTISGVAVEFSGNGKGYAVNDNGTPDNKEDDRLVYSSLLVNKSLTTKELKFADYAAGYLQIAGTLTTDAIYVLGETSPIIGKRAGSSIQIKGTTRTLEDGYKESGSVFFDEVLVYEEGENGEQNVTDVLITDSIMIKCESENTQDVPAGTKVITGKYLNPSDWRGYSYWFKGGDEWGENYRSVYLNDTDLCLGGVTTYEPEP